MNTDNPSEVAWEVKSSELRITQSEVVVLAVSQLNPHPDNRPLGSSEEKIRQLKIFITQNGFDSSHPIVVRPHQNGYQIIEGEHRFTAARALGYLKLPCVVRELSDTEALIQLVLGNIQTETKPLEIGLNALKVMQKEGKSITIQQYAQRLGLSDSTVRRYLNASEVYQFLKNQLPNGIPILDEVYKLEEIHRCPQADWYWMHDLCQKNEITKNQLTEITQATKEIKTDNPAVHGLFDLLALRQQVATEMLKGNKSIAETYKDMLETIASSHAQLDEEIVVYEYNVLSDNIQQQKVMLQQQFIDSLRELKNLQKQNVLETYKETLLLKRNGSLEEAQRNASYFKDKINAKEREEQEGIERQMRQVKAGEWWQLGQHFLYCGDGAEEAFFKKLPEKISLAFVQPSKIAQNASGTWVLDKLIIKAEIVAVAPELQDLQQLLRLSQMPYRWSLCAQIGTPKQGLGSWVYTALFSQKNIDTKLKDFWQIDATDLKGSKTKDYLKHLLENLSHQHDTIADLYGGNGTMILLAEEMNRKCYLAEINPALCKDLLEYWEDLSGGKAIKIST